MHALFKCIVHTKIHWLSSFNSFMYLWIKYFYKYAYFIKKEYTAQKAKAYARIKLAMQTNLCKNANTQTTQYPKKNHKYDNIERYKRRRIPGMFQKKYLKKIDPLKSAMRGSLSRTYELRSPFIRAFNNRSCRYYFRLIRPDMTAIISAGSPPPIYHPFPPTFRPFLSAFNRPSASSRRTRGLVKNRIALKGRCACTFQRFFRFFPDYYSGSNASHRFGYDGEVLLKIIYSVF